jgi:hypothetical protein
MSAQPTYKIVTANALDTGDVVYLTGCDEWSREIFHAEFIDDEDHAEFRLFVAEKQDRIVVAPYLAQVRMTDTGPVPVTRRETLRASGPSVPAAAPHAIAAE